MSIKIRQFNFSTLGKVDFLNYICKKEANLRGKHIFEEIIQNIVDNGLLNLQFANEIKQIL